MDNIEQSKIMLAFEYGILLSETAKNNNVELTSLIVKDAEEMIAKEFEKTPEEIAKSMGMNILSVFSTDAFGPSDDKKTP